MKRSFCVYASTSLYTGILHQAGEARSDVSRVLAGAGAGGVRLAVIQCEQHAAEHIAAKHHASEHTAAKHHAAEHNQARHHAAQHNSAKHLQQNTQHTAEHVAAEDHAAGSKTHETCIITFGSSLLGWGKKATHPTGLAALIYPSSPCSPCVTESKSVTGTAIFPKLDPRYRLCLCRWPVLERTYPAPNSSLKSAKP